MKVWLSLTDWRAASELTFQACVASKDTTPPVSCSHRRQLFLLNLRAGKTTIGLSEDETENPTLIMEVWNEQDVAILYVELWWHFAFNDFIYPIASEQIMMQ